MTILELEAQGEKVTVTEPLVELCFWTVNFNFPSLNPPVCLALGPFCRSEMGIGGVCVPVLSAVNPVLLSSSATERYWAALLQPWVPLRESLFQ